MKWKIEYDNDTGPGDEGFWEWWTVTNGEKSFKSDDEDDAKWLAEVLNRDDGNAPERPKLSNPAMKDSPLQPEADGRVRSIELLGEDRMSVHWPPSYRGRRPVKVRMACDLGPDMWGILGRGTPRHWVKLNDEVPVKVNHHGAMSLVTPYGELGVKPLECEIIEWRAPNESSSPTAADGNGGAERK